MDNMAGNRALARSPFSLSFDWTFVPTVLEDPIVAGYAPVRLPTEGLGLQAIGRIGCIGSVQIARLFHWKRHQIRRMLAEQKLVQHELKKNKNTIPIFTLGPRSIDLFKMDQPVNSWRHWSIESVLSKLVFFQFCCALQEKQKGFQILPAAWPFTGKVQMGEHIRYVLVLRGKEDAASLERELRYCSQPIIVLSENLENVIPYNDLLTAAHLLLDQDLREDYKFLRHRAGEWQRS